MTFKPGLCLFLLAMKLHLLFLFMMARKSAIPVSAMVLKGIPEMLSPELLEVLASMGQGDSVAIANAYFPAARASSEGPRTDGIKG